MSVVADILAEVAERGVTLQVQAGRLRFYPRTRVPPDLIGRLRGSKAALVAILQGGTGGSDAVEKPILGEEGPPGKFAKAEKWMADAATLRAKSGLPPWPEPPAVFPADTSGRCWWCGSKSFWRSAVTAGVVRCRNCHPPAPGCEAVPNV